MTAEPTIEVRIRDDKFEVVARQGEHAGWALRKNRQEAIAMAKKRLRAEVEEWWGS